MKKLLLCLAAVASLSACKVDSVASAGSAPAPLQGQTIDEKTLLVAVDSFETALTAVDKLLEAKIIVPGTPQANGLAACLSDARDFLNAAAGAQRAGSSVEYLAALANARAAITEAGKALRGGGLCK